MKKRILAMLLAMVMVVGLLPMGTIFADSGAVTEANGYIVAEFQKAKVTVGAEKAKLVLYYDSKDVSFTGIQAVIDWSELGAATDSAKFKSLAGMGLTVNTDGIEFTTLDGSGSETAGDIGKVLTYETEVVGNVAAPVACGDYDESFVEMTFEFNEKLIPGRYEVPVTVKELTKGGIMGKEPVYYVSLTNPIRLTAVLEVADEAGNVPARVPESSIAVNVATGAQTGSVSVAPKAAEGRQVTVTATPANGYEIAKVEVTKAGGEAVSVTEADLPKPVTGPKDYTFTMPDEAVTVRAEFTPSVPAESDYAITVSSDVRHGSVRVDMAKAEAGKEVVVYVTPDAGYRVDTVTVTSSEGKVVTVTAMDQKGPDGELMYKFAMPDSKVSVGAAFKANEHEVPIEGVVPAGKVHIKGMVVTGEQTRLKGAEVVLTCSGNGTLETKTVVTGEDGIYDFGELDSQYSYQVQARYATGVLDGMRDESDRQAVCVSDVKEINGKVSSGEWAVQVLTVTLSYDWDCNGDGKVETIYAGPDDTFLTTDDYYKATVGGQEVKVYPNRDGEKNLRDGEAHYYWEVDDDGVKEPVYVGETFQPGSTSNYYLVDVDPDGLNPNIPDGEQRVYIGADLTPATADDYLDLDVNGDSVNEKVYAGEAARIPDSGNYYNVAVGDKVHTVHVGDDKVAGTADDWYLMDVDGDGTDDKVFVGADGILGTADDFYPFDVDGDGVPEKVKAGEDKVLGTADDCYGYDVDRNPETPDVDVFVGPDRKPGTADDWYVSDVNGDGKDETVYVGQDGKPGTADDWYWMHKEPCGCVQDTDGDGVADTECPCTPDGDNCGCWVKVTAGDKDHGGDNVPGTKDDWYFADVDGDGEDEKVYVGDDKKPGTADDFYYADISWDANGGTTTAVKVLTVDLKEVPTATRSGYNFNGWTLEADKGTILTLDQLKALKVDTTLYASWTRRYYSSGSSGGSRPTGGNPQPVVITDPETPLAENPVLDAVKKIFNLDHIAYIVGYSDGKVHADENMTRAQAALVFYRLLNENTRSVYKTNSHDFSDLEKGAWYETAVATLAKMGIMTGYGNGKFGPDDHMTRGEFAAICARIGGFSGKADYLFVDVPEDYWAHDAICAVAKAGWMTGYGDSTFGPHDFVTRASVVTMLNRILARDRVTKESFASLKSQPGFKDWNDIDEQHWAYLDLIEAGNGHDQKTGEDGMELWTGLTKD